MAEKKWDGDFAGNPAGYPADSNPLGDSPQMIYPVRVRFGKREHQLLDLPIAEGILCAMSERFPVLFGRLIAEAMVGPEAAANRKERIPT